MLPAKILCPRDFIKLYCRGKRGEGVPFFTALSGCFIPKYSLMTIEYIPNKYYVYVDDDKCNLSILENNEASQKKGV